MFNLSFFFLTKLKWISNKRGETEKQTKSKQTKTQEPPKPETANEGTHEMK